MLRCDASAVERLRSSWILILLDPGGRLRRRDLAEPVELLVARLGRAEMSRHAAHVLDDSEPGLEGVDLHVVSCADEVADGRRAHLVATLSPLCIRQTSCCTSIVPATPWGGVVVVGGDWARGTGRCRCWRALRACGAPREAGKRRARRRPPTADRRPDRPPARSLYINKHNK